MERDNEDAMKGYRVLRFWTREIRDGSAVELIHQFIARHSELCDLLGATNG